MNFEARRNKLLDNISLDSLIVLVGASTQYRNHDTEHLFRQESNFYYLTGFNEPDSAIILIKDSFGSSKSILFCRPKLKEYEIWNGSVYGLDYAKKKLNFTDSKPINELNEYLINNISNYKNLYCMYSKLDLISSLISQSRSSSKNKKKLPHNIHNLELLLSSMRLIKDKQEIENIQKAVDASVYAHKELIKMGKNNLYEYKISAKFQELICQKGNNSTAYPSIVASGKNATVLHYVDNDSKLKSGDLLLIDAGAEHNNYASDITRTYPVNGKFSYEQKEIYNLVLTAQEEVINMITPGVKFNLLQEKAVKILTQGLIDLKILSGNLDTNIKNKTYTNYYMHGVSHWLGLDVHDQSLYLDDNGYIDLQPGMILTVEPGLYFRMDSAVDKKWLGIGIRIEDDILVTQNGCTVLSHKLPKTIHEIEGLFESDS